MKKRDPLMVEVLAALGDVVIEEAYIEAPDEDKIWVHGQYLDGVVTVNPAPIVVDTLIHEMLHHLRPDWSEMTVRRRTTQLMRQMTHDEARAIYREWENRRVRD